MKTKKETEGRESLRKRVVELLKKKRFWQCVIVVVLLVVLGIGGYFGYETYERKQVCTEIMNQCDAVEQVDETVLKDARNRRRATFIVTVPQDFSEDEREEVEAIVKSYYEKYYFVIYQ